MPKSSIWPKEIKGNRVDLALVIPEYFDASTPVKVSIRKTFSIPTYVAHFDDGKTARGKIAFWHRTSNLVADKGEIGLSFQFSPVLAGSMFSDPDLQNVGALAIAKAKMDSQNKLTGFYVWQVGCSEMLESKREARLDLNKAEDLNTHISESCELSSVAEAIEKSAKLEFDEEAAVFYQVVKK
ncbi:hypothetical protein PsB1_2234 [Candidatus Phycosocius spiralis]|uniref:Uncharacterized protein n=2 Tax=Candidatus Phycosocius spiralis TaxID=2815099 RepID=A0ABQ4PYL7_9PROT|nr:hypothetical protein PsB1_2234 [Candidatus Phycosocius spiralis]